MDCGSVSCEWSAARGRSAARAAARERNFKKRICRDVVSWAVRRLGACVIGDGCLLVAESAYVSGWIHCVLLYVSAPLIRTSPSPLSASASVIGRSVHCDDDDCNSQVASGRWVRMLLRALGASGHVACRRPLPGGRRCCRSNALNDITYRKGRVSARGLCSKQGGRLHVCIWETWGGGGGLKSGTHCFEKCVDRRSMIRAGLRSGVPRRSSCGKE